MKENNEVVSAEKDTKKLNESSRNTRERLAGIALVCLGSYLEDGRITQEQFERIRVLADRGKNTPIAKESETSDVEYVEQSIAYLEEYLKEQGV